MPEWNFKTSRLPAAPTPKVRLYISQSAILQRSFSYFKDKVGLPCCVGVCRLFYGKKQAHGHANVLHLINLTSVH